MTNSDHEPPLPMKTDRPLTPGWYACHSRDMEPCSLYWIDEKHIKGLPWHFDWYYGPLPLGPDPESEDAHA